MAWNIHLKYRLYILSLLAFSGSFAQGQVNVLTRNYNNQRTGANLSETILTASNVNSSQFGKLFTLPVDDEVYAGILYVSGLQIAGGTHNVIYAATQNNSVYAFDADTLGPPLWFKNFNGTGQALVSSQIFPGYYDYQGNIGIVGTPVIDGSAQTMYFVTRTLESGTTVQRLHAINITTGAERANSPQVIQATAPQNASIQFDPGIQNQRPALALSQGVVYIAWASYGDEFAYYGWVVAYNSTTLSRVGTFNDAPGGSQAGIWMAGAGPAFDAAGNVYFATGNGSFDGVTDFGESLVKLSPGSINELDYFAPADYATLNADDLDFGSAGPTLLPGTSLIIQGGKEGRLFLLNTNSLGHESAGDVQIPQVFQAVDTTIRPYATHHIHNASPAWNAPSGLNVYVWGENDFIHAFQLNPSTQTLNTTPLATGSILPPQGMPGGMMTISASGSQSGTGIVWATTPRNGDANVNTVPGNLYAFNAENLNLLWSSTGTGDDLLNFSKGSAPIVANGKVYVGSLSKFVTVYGLKSAGQYSQDLALNRAASGSAPCTASETPSQAVNGSFSGGLNDKWCSAVANPYLLVDLGSPQDISRFVVEHAGAGGEAFSLNTAAFNIQTSSDGVNFTTVVSVTGNVDSITTHDIAPITARYVQLNIVTPTQSGNPPASIYEFQVFGPPSGTSSDFSLSTSAGSQTVTAGGTASYTATVGALNGFTGTVTLSASGLPAGTTASFNPDAVNGAGTSAVSLLTTGSTPAGTYTVTIMGISGTLQHSSTVTLIVNAAVTSAGGEVNLVSVYNRDAMVTDGSTFTSGSLDNQGNDYSANLLGSTVSFHGSSFTLGPANAPDAVSSTNIPLPAGEYATLGMLATGVNGNQATQTFVVNYSDGTSSTFVQNMSDWFTPQSYAGESVAVAMAYRDTSAGTKDMRTFYLYGYSFALNSAKTARSITLPNNGNVVVLAITLVPVMPATDFSLSVSPGSQTVTAGGTGSYTASVGALNGFTGTVTLSASGLPAGASASFNPNAVNGAGTSAVSLLTTGSTPAGTYTVTITGISGTLQHSSTVTLVVNAASFSLSVSPGSETVTAGGTGSYTASVGALNGFTGTVTLSASGLPAGTTAGFNPNAVNGAGTSAVSLSTTGSTPAGTYTVTITGVSGTLQHTSTVTLVVNAASVSGTGGESVNLASVYNRDAMATDGSTFTSGSLDNQGNDYSANLLGSTVSFQGSSFTLGPANAPDAVTSTNIPLPPGEYATLGMLATGVNGNQASQTFVVNYSDGTSSTFVQGMSDWHTPQSYAGESVAVTMAYRDTSAGTKDMQTFYLYGYSFTVNSAKTATSITLPSNGNVVVLAITLVPFMPAADFSLSVSPASQTVTAGGTGGYTASVGALNGFTGTVTLSASGLPAGTNAGFNPDAVNGAGTSVVSLLTTGSTPAGNYTVTITGVSGTLQHSSTMKLVVNAAVTSPGGAVNLASVYNRDAMVTDGSTFTSGSLDNQGNDYSANLLGSTVSFQGSSFALGPANAPDAVTSTNIPLPPGEYATLGMLATGVNGNQASQTFVVNYSDGSSSTFVQSMSDWFTPQSYAGESVAVAMAYRDTSAGTKDMRTFYLYGYSFTVNSAKTATSITLPSNGNVVVLAITIVP